MRKTNIDPKKYMSYLKAFEKKFPDHVGCGIGIERFVRWLCDLDDIADTTIFPRRGTILEL